MITRAAVAGVSLLVGFGALGAQESIVIRGGDSCVRCASRLEHVVSLGAQDGPGALSGGPRSLTRDSRGNYLLIDYQEDTQVFVFDSLGAFVTSVGRAGQGPGEYRALMLGLVGPRDTVHLFDMGNRRETVLSPEWELVRTVPRGFMADRGFRHPDGTVVLNGIDGRDPLSVEPVQTYSWAGDSIAVFGHEEGRDADTPLIQTRPEGRGRAVGPAGSGAVWVGRWNAYELTRHRIDGTVLEKVRRETRWFSPYTEWSPPAPGEPPKARLWAVHGEGARRVWTATIIAGKRWEEGLGEPLRRGERTVYPVDDPGRMWDSRVELLDTETGTVEVSFSVEEQVLGFLDSRTVYSVRYDAFGVPYVDIWRIVIG